LSESNDLIKKIKLAADKNLDKYVVKALNASAEHGTFGMEIVDRLHDKLPRTSCGNCGKCCNSVSIYSLEYHRIMREIMTTWQPERIRRLVSSIMDIESRKATADNEKRLRCTFRDEHTRMCLIHPVRPFPCRIFGLLKENGLRECENVNDLAFPAQTVTQDYLIDLQIKLPENSEAFEPYPKRGKIHFFPFEFWFFRYVFSPERALQIYRDVLVPISTPLTKMWETNQALPKLEPADYEL